MLETEEIFDNCFLKTLVQHMHRKMAATKMYNSFLGKI